MEDWNLDSTGMTTLVNVPRKIQCKYILMKEQIMNDITSPE